MRIETFTMDGDYVNSIPLTYGPVGIEVDLEADTVYVADTLNSSIHVYRI